MAKLIKILLIFWAAIGIFFVSGAVYLLITGYTYDGYTWLALGAASAVMYWMNTKRMKVYGKPQNPGAVQEQKKK